MYDLTGDRLNKPLRLPVVVDQIDDGQRFEDSADIEIKCEITVRRINALIAGAIASPVGQRKAMLGLRAVSQKKRA